MGTMPRNHVLTIRLNDRWYQALDRYAEETDLAKADVMRQALRELLEKHPEVLRPRPKPSGSRENR